MCTPQVQVCNAFHSLPPFTPPSPFLPPPQKLLVEYVDYGNEEELDKIKLRKALDTELYSLPHQVRYLGMQITEP